MRASLEKSLLSCFLLLSLNFSAEAKPQVDNGLHTDWMEPSVAAGINFFLYANGMWQKNNPIPSYHASWSSFSELMEKIEDLMHQLVVNASQDKHAAPGSLTQKVGDFYYSGMDVKTINREGYKPLQPIFSKIEQMKSLDDLPALVASLHLMGVHALFDFGSMQDFKDSQQMIAAMIQGGLTLPDKDYYLKQDKSFQEVRTAFTTYLQTVFKLTGETSSQAETHAKLVLKIETLLAESSKPQEALRDPQAIYHVMRIDALNKMTPNFAWDRYLKALNLSQVDTMNVATPEFTTALNKHLSALPIDAWRVYLKWHVLSAFADDLSTPFEEAAFKMAQTLRGMKTMPVRWKRVLREESNALGFAMGELYVKKYAKESVKQQVTEITENIYEVLKQELKTLEWMSPETRKAAIAKLMLMKKRIGYPVTWWDYSSLPIVKGPYVSNVIQGNMYLARRNFSKIGKPVDVNEWYMTPQMVNAYYDSSMNNITIPMGILASPFFDEKAPSAVNYGAIGSVIGHEITHGFDDQGAQFDGYGNLNNWWTKEDLRKFQQATSCLSKQFSQYKVGDLSLKGPLVVGEATADLGGVKLAYQAFHASKDYKDAKNVDGFTPDQQFFLGFAHTWANQTRPQQAKLWVITDPHPPAMYRVNGTLVNIEGFKDAFKLPKSENEHICVIW